MSKNNDFYNSEHYPDPVAFQAINNIEEESRVKRLIGVIFYIVNLAGYQFEGRIVLRNKKTGKVWR